jgi:hypothetical protein
VSHLFVDAGVAPKLQSVMTSVYVVVHIPPEQDSEDEKVLHRLHAGQDDDLQTQEHCAVAQFPAESTTIPITAQPAEQDDTVFDSD